MSYQHIEQFRQAIADSRLTPPDRLIADGVLHRFSETGESWKKNAWYVFFPDGEGGVFGCWVTGITENWRAETGRTPSDDEVAAYRAKVEEAKRQRDAEKQRMQLAAKERAAKDWEAATPADPSNEYLQRKGIQPHGVRQVAVTNNVVNLLVPMFADGEIWSTQTIFSGGGKMFATGGRVSGCYYPIGETEGAEVVCIAEGFATAASVYEATGYPTYCGFNAGNLLHVAKAVRLMHPDAQIIIAGDDDWQSEGNVGKVKATEASIAIGAEVVFPVFGVDRDEGGDTDFNDMAQATGLESVRAVFAGGSPDVEQDTEPQGEPTSDSSGASDADASTEKPKMSKAAREALLERLAGLSGLDYEQERGKAAEALGVRTTALDAEVKKLRKEADSTSGIDFDEVEPWGDEVPLAELLDNIAATIRRFVVCDKAMFDAAALWVVMTWLMDIVQVAPLALITAPEKGCGKSTLLTVLGRMVCRALQASSIAPAALYRVVERCRPTLMLDETDAFMRENEELRGIINSGHTRDSAYVIRCVGDDHSPTRFSTWGAKALSGIGKLSETIMDRSIILPMRKKLAHEKVDRLRQAEPNLFGDIASQIKRAVDDNRDAVRLCRPELPSQLGDRQQDNWEPLLAIADVAGNGWGERARSAALTLSGEVAPMRSIGNELLSDIHDVFAEKRVDKIWGADLIKALCSDEEKPWATYNRGRPISPRQLSARLGEYDIKSKGIKIGVVNQRGYQIEQFKDAFDRYLFSGVGGGESDGETVAGSTCEEKVAHSDFVSATLKPATSKESNKVALVEGGCQSERVVVSV